MFLNNEHAYDEPFRELRGASVEQLDNEVQRIRR
jgi:hypothetical protein